MQRIQPTWTLLLLAVVLGLSTWKLLADRHGIQPPAVRPRPAASTHSQRAERGAVPNPRLAIRNRGARHERRAEP